DTPWNSLFGANTVKLSRPIAPPSAGAALRVSFVMPALLGVGEYTLSVAVASYEWDSAHIYDWIDQALRFIVVRSRTLWTTGSAFCPISVSCAIGGGASSTSTATSDGLAAWSSGPAACGGPAEAAPRERPGEGARASVTRMCRRC